MTSFSSFEYFDAFQLDVNVVYFVYYRKTRLATLLHTRIDFGLLRILLFLCLNLERQNQDFSDGLR